MFLVLQLGDMTSQSLRKLPLCGILEAIGNSGYDIKESDSHKRLFSELKHICHTQWAEVRLEIVNK